MPRFKTKFNVFDDNAELFLEESAQLNNGVYLPESWNWESNKQISAEDVVIWECLFEQSGSSGIYAAWAPYEEFYIVTEHKVVVREFFGDLARNMLHKYCVENNIPAPVRYNKHKVKFLEGVAS